MRLHPIAPVIALIALTACGGSKEDNQVTETRMDDIDSLEGTISDDAINMDESTDEAPVEAAPVEAAPAETVGKADEQPKARPDKEQAKNDGGPAIVKIEAEKPVE